MSVKLIEEFLLMKQNDVLEFFHTNYKSSFFIGSNELKSVYIPPQRNDGVLLSVHADTVWLDSKIKLKQYDNLILSDNVERGVNKKSGNVYCNGIGIGADDRAGCAMAHILAQRTGHAVLITGQEETGCLSSCQIMSTQQGCDLINKHQFVVGLDRKGQKDLVFYSNYTEKFEKYCIKETDYECSYGNGSDITVLCQNICGVNVSVGYRNEHSVNECLNLLWWNKTLKTLTKWLEQKGIPKHEL